jgi:hypothetical protein
MLIAAPLVPRVNACPQATIPAAPTEPYVRRGPTEVVVGLYIQGGALIPGCKMEPRGPYAGTVTLRRKGKLAARQTISQGGHLFVFHVAPGTYTITGHEGSTVAPRPATVTVRRGQTVREDLFTDVP